MRVFVSKIYKCQAPFAHLILSRNVIISSRLPSNCSLHKIPPTSVKAKCPLSHFEANPIHTRHVGEIRVTGLLPLTHPLHQSHIQPASPRPGNTLFSQRSEDDYANQLGSLGYLRFTRADLCVALGVASQFAKKGRYGPPHFRALRNIMRYVKHTPNHGLLYQSSGKTPSDPWVITASVDSDWASCKDTRRSRTG